MRVLFFAIVPPRDAAADIWAFGHRLRERLALRGTLRARSLLHVSILGLGDETVLPRGLLALACEAASNVAMPRFAIAFDRVGHVGGRWNKPGLALQGGDGAIGATLLHENLADAMRRRGLAMPRQSFSPHMTLYYGAHRISERPVEPIIPWIVEELVLIRSTWGQGRHDLVAKWKLRAMLTHPDAPPRVPALRPSARS